MRVLQLTKFYPPFRGGIESVAYELASGLNAKGTKTDVLCAQHQPGGTVREITSEGTPVTRVRSFGRILSTSMAPQMLWELQRIRKNHAVIHVHLPDPLTNLALLVARPTARIVVHWHSDVVHQRIALKVYAPLQQWLLRRADAIVVTSEAYGRASPWLQDFAAKCHVIPIGIRDISEDVAPASVEALRRRFAGRKLIFALGRLVYYKGFEHLVKAAALLPEDHVVVIGGVGELSDTLRSQIASLGLEHRVFLVGNIPEDDMPTYWAAADVFCLPSTHRSEAFGVVLLEAMRAGKPIVATLIPGSGVPWVNQDEVTGFNVAPASPPALAGAILKITSDEILRARLSAGARNRFSTIFTSERMVDRVQQLYQQVTSAGPHAAESATSTTSP